jgi:hypothetical protein
MAQSPSTKKNAHSSYKAVAPQMYATPTCMSTISERNHSRLRCSLLFEPVKYMIFPLDLPSIQNHLEEHFERHFSSSRKIEANTVHAMINIPWLINEYRFTTHWFHNFHTSCFSAFLVVVGLKLYQQTYNLSIGS